MKPIYTKYTTCVLGAPKDWESAKHGLCIGLPVRATDDPYVYSWWRLTWRERLAVLFGRPVRLCVVGSTMPPVALEVSRD